MKSRKHASKAGHKKICIRSSDTDVEVLACYHQETIEAELIIATGTRTKLRLISIPQVRESIGLEVCDALLGLHALTGCDSVSSFVGKGRQKALKLLADESNRAAISTLGETVPPDKDDLVQIERFVCQLYQAKGIHTVNETRYTMFCKINHLQSHQLPPTIASLIPHIKRANYQSFIWKNVIIHEVNPCGRGWCLVNGALEVCWLDVAPAPTAVLELTSFKCQGKRCSRVKLGLPCTDACSCGDVCANIVNQTEDTNHSDDSEDELID